MGIISNPYIYIQNTAELSAMLDLTLFFFKVMVPVGLALLILAIIAYHIFK